MMIAGYSVTLTVTVAENAPLVAVICAVPWPLAVTRPPASTMATEASDERQRTAAAMACPLASCPVTTSCTVSPTASSVTASVDTVRPERRCCTVTATRIDTEPLETVTVVMPLPRAVTSPLGSTVATLGSVESQRISADSVPPLASCALAFS